MMRKDYKISSIFLFYLSFVKKKGRQKGTKEENIIVNSSEYIIWLCYCHVGNIKNAIKRIFLQLFKEFKKEL